MELRQRAITVVAALVLTGACWTLGCITPLTTLTVSAAAGKHHPTPSPTPVTTPPPSPTPRPTPPPTPTPRPTPAPTPPATPAPTPAPSVPAATPAASTAATPSADAATSLPSEAPAAAADVPASALPYTGPSAQSDGAQALLLTPTPVADAAVSGTVFGARDTTTLIWMILLAIVAIPGLIIMTLIATVLIRR